MWFVAPENDYRPLRSVPVPGPRLRVAVCMPVYNRVDLLARTVAALVPQTYPVDLMEVVVGDDGSDEDVAAALAPVMDRMAVSVVRREHDGYGAGQARNMAASATDADVLVFVDSDCLPDRDYVLRHAMWHHRADNLVVIGSRHGLDTTEFDLESLMAGTAQLRTAAFGTEFPDDGAVKQTDHRRPLHRQTADQRHGDEAFRSLVSSNFSIRRDRFLEVGGFDESFRRWGFEDVELGWRCQQAGLFTVPEDRAINYHQLQEDLWDPEGRRESMERNRGVVQNKVPHAFYRKHQRGHIWEVPKVSVVVFPTVPTRLAEIGDQIRFQSYTDWELIAEAGTPEATMFAEVNGSDPRFRVADVDDPVELVATARGEYVLLVHGDAAVEPQALADLVKRMDGGRRLSSATSAYAIGGTTVRDPETLHEIDRSWDQRNAGTPVFLFSRRRDWSKALHGAPDMAGAVRSLYELGGLHRHHQPLVALRSERPDASVGSSLPVFTNVTTRLRRDVAAAGVGFGSVKAVGKYLLRRDPVAERVRPSRPPRSERTPVVRYVGWTGHENLGDEALLQAVIDVMPWSDVRTAKRGDLLLLGGGTLINRGSYITWLEDHDAPRIERAVFGTGVANPGFWGEPPDRDRWVEWLSTCAYIGVRGPLSAEILADWNVPTEVEVVGDAALLFEPAVESVEGRVVLAPCRTRGELWGGDDTAVFERLAATASALIERGHDVHLLACHPDDDGPCLEIMRRAGRPDLPYTAGYADLHAAIELLGSAELVVAERLHAAVLAAAADTPFVALEYRPKLRDFAASVDMAEWVLKTDELDGLEELVWAAIAQRNELRARMRPRIIEYRGKLRNASATLEDFMKP